MDRREQFGTLLVSITRAVSRLQRDQIAEKVRTWIEEESSTPRFGRTQR